VRHPKIQRRLKSCATRRKNFMNTGEEKLRFDTLSEDGLSYIACYYAFATPERAAELHRQHGYRVRFNKDPKYPQILDGWPTFP
jgi:hypothetical protein